jgi:uncharacterized DUF497 family protein
MRFSWDEQKNANNFAKHGVRFERATLVFGDPAPSASWTITNLRKGG